MNKIVLVFILSFCAVPLLSQVAINDRIAHRIELKLDEPSQNSSTNHSSVEWNCINKKLTQKCLIYHNDQWFSFTPPSSGPFYLTIAGQKCNKGYGVQVVLIEGNPCEVTTYKLKKCVDFSDAGDFFVVLDSLKSGTEYLINVDGYLGDVCEFNIAVNVEPQGVPVKVEKLAAAEASVTSTDSVVHLKWSTPPHYMATADYFTVYRKKFGDQRSVLTNRSTVRNSYGIAQKDYVMTDTLHGKGEYTYQIFLYSNEGVFLVAKETVVFKDRPPVGRRSNIRHIDYFVREKGSVTISILNTDKRVLARFVHRSSKGHNVVKLDFTPYLEGDAREFVVTLRNKHIDEGRSIRFSNEREKY